jgi:hypothetical protein
MKIKLTCTLLLLLALTACFPQDPIIVYVTPTAQPTSAASVATALTATTAPASATPTETATVAAQNTTAIVTTIVPTATVLPTQPPTIAAVVTFTPAASPQVIGPLIGPGYVPPTLPPTPETPAPTPAPATASADAATPIEGTAVAAAPEPTQVPQAGTFAPLPNLDPNLVGIQLDINLSQEDWNDAMGRIENLGVKWIKVQLPWRDMQPNGPDERGTEFFRRIEQHLEEASRRNFNVMVSVVKAPAWARSNQTEDGPPDDPNALARFITIIFEEFNAGLQRPTIGDYIDAVEIWNEPNLIREWQGTLPFTGAGYMRLFEPAYRAVRAYSPDITVIVAGLAPTGNSEGSVDDTEFLRQMYAAGLGNFRDVVIGAHPYGWGNAPDARCCGDRGWDDNPHFFYLETLDAYREIMNANGHQDVQMWITEFGYASWDGYPLDPPQPWMAFNSRWQQGGYTIRAIQLAQERGDIGVKILWNLNFAVLSGLITGRDERAAYSMLVPGGGCAVDVNNAGSTERPVYWMLYDAFRPEVQLQDWCGIPPNPIPGFE